MAWPVLIVVLVAIHPVFTFAQDESTGKNGEATPSTAKPDSTGFVLDRSSPRATMRTFLVAVQDASGEHPERIDDAAACLDIADLEEEGASERARLLARRLHAIIDSKGVKLDDIPDPPKDPDTYVFFQAEGAVGDDGSFAIIALNRGPSGDWLFSTETLASIPLLESIGKAEAKPVAQAASTVPVGRNSPRATISTFIEAMNATPPDMKTAIACLDPTGQDAQAWGVTSRDLSSTLKTVMDKIKVAVLAEIPNTPDGPPYIWHTGKSGNIVVARIEAETKDDVADTRFALQKGEWRFTPQTLKTLAAMYRDLEDQEIVTELQQAGVKERLTFRQRIERDMPEWLRAELLFLMGWQWLALGGLLLLGWLVRVIVAVIVGHLMQRRLSRSRLHIETGSQRRVARSIGALATVAFWYMAVQPLGLPPALLGFLLGATKLALGVVGVLAVYRIVDIVGGQIAANRDVSVTRFDDVLIPMLQKTLRIFIVIVGLLIAAEWMGWKPTTILGAIGVGGVALAFAAQDTIGNFFGSITVLFDRPFGIGDWIVIGDVEGTVERVGFRSTRVRTFYNSVVTIPNSKMVNTQVDNYGARRYRRAKILLSLTYDTPPQKIDAFCEGIRELIRLHPYTRKDYYHVYFNQFADSSLDVLLYTFFEVPDWGTELRERHRLFIDILSLADRLGVDFAYPTQRLLLERSGAKPDSSGVPLDDPDKLGHDEAAKLFEQSYGAGQTHRDPVVIERNPRSRRAQKGLAQDDQ